MAGVGKPGRKTGHLEGGKRACTTCSHPECARIDYLAASGASLRDLAAQFGLAVPSVHRHYNRHVSERYKAIIGSSRLESFDALMKKCVEGDGETLDILGLLMRGHLHQWSIAFETGSNHWMSQHAVRVQAALELRAKISRELVPAQPLTVNNYLLRDAAELVNQLEGHPEAIKQIEQWHEFRLRGGRGPTRGVTLEHDAAAD
jgi:hypothetical protein